MPEPTYHVRRLALDDPADAAIYLELLDAYARDPMGAARPLAAEVRERLPQDLAQHPGVHALVAEQAGTAIGFATCFLGYSTFRARPLLNIHDIAVLPPWRGRSAGSALLSAVEGLARELDCCRITLEVREDNRPARALYRQAGFIAADCNLFLEKPL